MYYNMTKRVGGMSEFWCNNVRNYVELKEHEIVIKYNNLLRLSE